MNFDIKTSFFILFKNLENKRKNSFERNVISLEELK